jgi:anti-sigma factor RsiW
VKRTNDDSTRATHSPRATAATGQPDGAGAPQPSGFDLDLMMHVDGELEAAEERAVASRMNEAARAKAAAVRELGELVRGHVELATDEAEPRLTGMWAEIGKRLDNEHAAARSSTSVPVGSGGFWSALGRWFDRYRGHLLTGTVSAGAVAALALLLRGDADPPRGGKSGTGPLSAALVSAPPEIESLDVPNGTGTVLTIEDEDGATAIVWVTPDDVEGI